MEEMKREMKKETWSDSKEVNVLLLHVHFYYMQLPSSKWFKEEENQISNFS